MERSKNYVVFGILALVVSLVAVSLAYAGFSQTLNINGTATVKSVSWDVHFSNLSSPTLVGTAKVTTAPTIKNNSTTIGDYAVELYSPGDSITYTFDVENAGNFNAKLTGLTVGTPTCSGPTNASTVCGYIKYELYDVTGTQKKLTAADNSVVTAKSGSTNGKRSYKLVLSYDSNIPQAQLPATDVSVSGLGITFTYTQDGNAVLGD